MTKRLHVVGKISRTWNNLATRCLRMGTSQFDSVVNSVSMIDTDESENNELVGITEAVQVSDSVSESNVQGTTNTKPTYVIPVNTDPVNADTADLQQADDVFTSSP